MGDGERTGVELRYGRTCLLESRQATGVCLFVSLATLIVLVAGCSRKEVVEKRFYPMGGLPFMVKAYNVPENLFEETFAEIKDETERLEKLEQRSLEYHDDRREREQIPKRRMQEAKDAGMDEAVLEEQERFLRRELGL